MHYTSFYALHYLLCDKLLCPTSKKNANSSHDLTYFTFRRSMFLLYAHVNLEAFKSRRKKYSLTKIVSVSRMALRRDLWKFDLINNLKAFSFQKLCAFKNVVLHYVQWRKYLTAQNSITKILLNSYFLFTKQESHINKIFQIAVQKIN